jgi:hypothetical protein
MQRAGRLVTRLKIKTASLSSEELAAAAWPSAVGKRLAGRTGPVRLFGHKLVVEVEDNTWQRQLMTLTPQILPKLQAILGPELVQHLEFRVGAPRREPARAEVADPRADGIEDPIFKLLYLTSRARSEREQERRERKSA